MQDCIPEKKEKNRVSPMLIKFPALSHFYATEMDSQMEFSHLA